jgi:hypothetical protein
VFTTELGRTIAPATLIRSWEWLLAAAGVGRVRLHAARHRAATVTLAAGVSLRVARYLLIRQGDSHGREGGIGG